MATVAEKFEKVEQDIRASINDTTWVVRFRTGGTANFSWHESEPVDSAERAFGMALDLNKMGYEAYVARPRWSFNRDSYVYMDTFFVMDRREA